MVERRAGPEGWPEGGDDSVEAEGTARREDARPDRDPPGRERERKCVSSCGRNDGNPHHACAMYRAGRDEELAAGTYGADG